MRCMNLALVLLVTILSHAAVATDAARPPNVVFLLADDVGFGDPHCYGHPYSQTPHIDRLAREGTRFTQFYVAGITCCPSRTAFMTSQFPARFASYPAVAGFGDRPTVTELLHRAGYATGHFGKWDIGPDEKPGTYGIDATPPTAPRAGHRHDERGRDAYTYDGAIRFIEQHRDRPFYVNVWGHIAHHPVDPPIAAADRFHDLVVKEADFPEPMRKKFALVRSLGGDVNKAMRNYLGELSLLDDAVGRLLMRLDELGLTENTIVVFTSDHGAPGPEKPPEMKGLGPASRDHARINLVGFNGNHRGGKATMNEGGVRVPFIVRWPGHVPAGRLDETSVTSGIDWLPTMCRLAGVNFNAADVDGEDVADAWLGGVHVRKKPLLWKNNHVKSEIAIRDGDWKLFIPDAKATASRLYDVVADPMESHDVAAKHPAIVRRLTGIVERWNATLPRKYVRDGF